MKATQTLLFLAQIDPLRSVPICEIQGIEKVGDSLKIKVNNPDGNGCRIENCKASEYVMKQILEFGLEYSEV